MLFFLILDNGLTFIAQKCRKLVSLDISFCDRITDKVFYYKI